MVYEKSKLNKLKKIELLELCIKELKHFDKKELLNFLLTKNMDTVLENTNITKEKIEVIDDSGIVEKHSNNGKTQTIIFKYKKLYWRLIIHSESYESQSYIRLYTTSTLNEWNIIKSGNPKKDYGIALAYVTNYKPDAFKQIIEDYKKIILKMG